MLCRWGFPFASCDNWNFNSSNPCLYAGGNYNQNQNGGMFYVNYNSASNSNDNIGARNQLGLTLNNPPLLLAQTAAHPMVKISNKGTG